MKCCICKGPIEVQINGWREGHNAEPASSGRCCSACNDGIVIPTRIARWLMKAATSDDDECLVCDGKDPKCPECTMHHEHRHYERDAL